MAFLRRRLVLMLVACDQQREAEEKRREASELARRLGLRPFLDLLQRDTISTGSLLSESASRPGTAIGLTPRQHSILSLIAKGLTNKELEREVVTRALEVPKSCKLIGYLCAGYPLSDDDKPALMRVGWEKCDPRAVTLLVR
jgi:hypothetical protein